MQRVPRQSRERRDRGRRDTCCDPTNHVNDKTHAAKEIAWWRSFRVTHCPRPGHYCYRSRSRERPTWGATTSLSRWRAFDLVRRVADKTIYKTSTCPKRLERSIAANIDDPPLVARPCCGRATVRVMPRRAPPAIDEHQRPHATSCAALGLRPMMIAGELARSRPACCVADKRIQCRAQNATNRDREHRRAAGCEAELRSTDGPTDAARTVRSTNIDGPRGTSSAVVGLRPMMILSRGGRGRSDSPRTPRTTDHPRARA